MGCALGAVALLAVIAAGDISVEGCTPLELEEVGLYCANSEPGWCGTFLMKLKDKEQPLR